MGLSLHFQDHSSGSPHFLHKDSHFFHPLLHIHEYNCHIHNINKLSCALGVKSPIACLKCIYVKCPPKLPVLGQTGPSCISHRKEKNKWLKVLKTLHPQELLEDMLFTMKVTIVHLTLLKHLDWDPETGSSSKQKALWYSWHPHFRHHHDFCRMASA